MRVRMAINHWKLAVEVHNTNFPKADHDCRDVSATDPRRYPSTDILAASPECTTHSPAGGNRKASPQRDIFDQGVADAAKERSRVTMRDVPRFAEFHQYRHIIVENVVEVTRWGPKDDGSLFRHWLREMELLGYRWQLVSLNSMFCWPTPQSRDRLYIIFSRKGERTPRMDITPQAPCPKCEKVVAGVQTWRPRALTRAINGQPFGKYGALRQYVYTCPVCATEVLPYYFAAINAIDFSLRATRIGDRASLGMPELRPRTKERIRYGLKKYGRRTLVVNIKQGERDSSRAWPADLRPMGSVPTWDGYFGVASPGALVNVTRSGLDDRVRDPMTDAGASQTAQQEIGLASPPFMVGLANGGPPTSRVRGLDEPTGSVHAQGNNFGLVFNVAGRDSEATFDRPMPTQETREKFGLCFLATLRGSDEEQYRSVGMGEAIGTISAGGIHHALIGPGFAPFIATARTHNEPRGVDEPLTPINTGNHHLVVQGGPLIVPLQGITRAKGLDEELPTQTASCSHEVIVSGAAQISLRDADAMRVAGLDSELMTQGKAPQQGLIQRAPFITSYYIGGGQVSPLDDAAPAMVAREAHGMVYHDGEIPIEDCYFRMLQPHEIGLAMAFRRTYKVLGNKREQVKGYGNAVTPPAMRLLIDRVLEALYPEVRT